MYDGLQEEYLIKFRIQDEDREAVHYQQIHEAGQQPAAPADAQTPGRTAHQRPGWTAVLKGLFRPGLTRHAAH